MTSSWLELSTFAGPIDYLLLLVHKGEVELIELTLMEIMDHYRGSLEPLDRLESDLDQGAEFIQAMAQLIYWKSKELLPSSRSASWPTEELLIAEEPLDKGLVEKLIAYRQMKQASLQLLELERSQEGCYSRADLALPANSPIKRGLESISLEQLSSLFASLLSKAKARTTTLYEERWRVADKRGELLASLAEVEQLPFVQLFHEGLCREELIVLFLALLELIKQGEMNVMFKQDGEELLICRKPPSII